MELTEQQFLTCGRLEKDYFTHSDSRPSASIGEAIILVSEYMGNATLLSESPKPTSGVASWQASVNVSLFPYLSTMICSPEICLGCKSWS